MAEYELTYIIRPDVSDDAVEGVHERVAEAIAAGGGHVTRTLDWGRRRLAFPINRETSGTYVTHRIEIEPEAIEELSRTLRFYDVILRHMVVTTDDVPPPPPPAPIAPEGEEEGAEVADEPAAEADEPAEEPAVEAEAE